MIVKEFSQIPKTPNMAVRQMEKNIFEKFMNGGYRTAHDLCRDVTALAINHQAAAAALTATSTYKVVYALLSGNWLHA